MMFEDSLDFAKQLDADDVLNSFRQEFHFPKNPRTQEPFIYFCGNSLGLQPKSTASYLQQELKDWAELGVEGHMHAKSPWIDYQHFGREDLANVVGGKTHEVVAMNSLTVNLHLLMVSFYRPTKQRFKILMESRAFPSDQYAIASQVKFHGLDPQEVIVEVGPRAGEDLISTETFAEAIRQHGDQLAMVLIGGVNYSTGQLFDLGALASLTHQHGALIGVDLAHATGNVPLKLHDQSIDFAAWCSYKYLNSGPGSVAGAFIHEKHFADVSLPRFEGWWGNRPQTRFQMKPQFEAEKGIDAWQISNVPIFSTAPLRASLDVFKRAGMTRLREKSLRLTGYLEYLLMKEPHSITELVTSKNPEERGCQLSLRMKKNGRSFFEHLVKEGVLVDWREPDIIRFAPVPLYNTFAEVYQCVHILRKALKDYETR